MSLVTITALSAILLLVSAVSAHICFVYPAQRGESPKLQPGDPLCFNRVPNCGNLKKGAAKTRFIQNIPYTLQFQQNLNHWYQPKPGYFDFAISYDNDTTWTSLGGRISDFPANNMDTQTFFNFPVAFTTSGSATIRGRYVSHNPYEVDPANNTDAIFYTCADVEVLSQGVAEFSQEEMTLHHKMRIAAVAEKKVMKESRKRALLLRKLQGLKKMLRSDTLNCETPSLWEAHGKEQIEGQPNSTAALEHHIQYDAKSGWIRWHRSNKATGYSVTDLWNLTMAHAGYTPQYILGLSGANTCVLYGGDKFLPWSFGNTNGMEYWHSYTKHTNNGRDEQIAVFGIPSADFEFSAVVLDGKSTSVQCLPRAITHGLWRVDFEAKEVSSFPANTFAVPTICKSNLELPEAGCKAKHH